MDLSNLRPPKGAKHSKKRIGRGQGSGQGSRRDAGTRARSRARASSTSAGSKAARCRCTGACRSAGSTTRSARSTRSSTSTRSASGSRPASSHAGAAARAAGSSDAPAQIKVLARGDIVEGADGPGAQVQRQGGREDRRRRRQGRSPRIGGRSYAADSLKNIFAVADLRKRVLFTLGLLAVYRVGGHIPTPGINPEALALLADQAKNTMFGLYDMFSGRNLSQMTIFALGIMPYISSSIILQLLTVVWPYLERLSKEGELGRRKITQYTRYGTILLSVVQSLGIAYLPRAEHRDRRRAAAGLQPGLGLPADDGADADDRAPRFIMWLGEQITERGIGNGMSLIIFAGIVVNLPQRGRSRPWTSCGPGRWGSCGCSLLIVLMVAVIAAIVFVERGHRRVTVQYAKRVVGRRMYGGSSTHIPLKVNTGGVIPVIFASSILAFPATLAPLFGEDSLACGGADRADRAGHAAATTCSTSPASSSSATSTPRSSSTRMTSRRTCGSTAGSSRGSGRASGRRSTSTRS